MEIAQPSKKVKKPKELKLGDSVHVISLNLDGIVSSLPNQSGNFFVQMGILRSQINSILIEDEEEYDRHDVGHHLHPSHTLCRARRLAHRVACVDDVSHRHQHAEEAQVVA